MRLAKGSKHNTCMLELALILHQHGGQVWKSIIETVDHATEPTHLLNTKRRPNRNRRRNLSRKLPTQHRCLVLNTDATHTVDLMISSGLVNVAVQSPKGNGQGVAASARCGSHSLAAMGAAFAAANRMHLCH